MVKLRAHEASLALSYLNTQHITALKSGLSICEHKNLNEILWVLLSPLALCFFLLSAHPECRNKDKEYERARCCSEGGSTVS